VDGGRQAIQHLVDLGHTRIAYVSDYLDSPFGFQASARRLEGYREVLSKNDILIREDYHKQGEHGRHPAHRLTEELLALDEPPTAIFAASDTQALGVIEAIEEMGLKVPDDVSVVGYDDIEIAAYLGLTTIHQPMYHSGVEGVNALLQLLTNGLPTLPLSTTMPVRLIVRETTGPPVS
jgi:DNA-binding LacI/PurR family transcriptional regulator